MQLHGVVVPLFYRANIIYNLAQWNMPVPGSNWQGRIPTPSINSGRISAPATDMFCWMTPDKNTGRCDPTLFCKFDGATGSCQCQPGNDGCPPVLQVDPLRNQNSAALNMLPSTAHPGTVHTMCHYKTNDAQCRCGTDCTFYAYPVLGLCVCSECRNLVDEYTKWECSQAA